MNSIGDLTLPLCIVCFHVFFPLLISLEVRISDQKDRVVDELYITYIKAFDIHLVCISMAFFSPVYNWQVQSPNSDFCLFDFSLASKFRLSIPLLTDAML